MKRIFTFGIAIGFMVLGCADGHADNPPIGLPPPTIISLLRDQTICVGAAATFSVSATDASYYQWRKNGGDISGATSSTLTINNVTVNDAGDYSVVVGNDYGNTTSGTVHLATGTDPPMIITQPRNQAVLLGATQGELAQLQGTSGDYVGGNSASFSVIATGCDPMSYQWKKNGVNVVDGGKISGAQSQTLTIGNANNPVSTADAGSYMVEVKNPNGTINSAIVSLSVCQSVPSYEDIVLASKWDSVQVRVRGGPPGGVPPTTLTVHFHVDSLTPLSGFQLSAADSSNFGVSPNYYAVTLGGVRGILAFCRVYASATCDPQSLVSYQAVSLGGEFMPHYYFGQIIGTKIHFTSTQLSQDYTFVFDRISIMSGQQNASFWGEVSWHFQVSAFKTVGSVDWNCQGPATLPLVTFSPNSGTVPVDVTMSVPSYPAAQIYYTLDSSTPTRSSHLYTGPVPITTAITVKAIAVQDGFPDGPISTADYYAGLPKVVFSPIWSPVPAYVAMSVPGYNSANIYYTLDGSTPTRSSALYTSAIYVGTATTVKAFAVQGGMADGPVSSANYGGTPPPGNPVQIVTEPQPQTVVVGKDTTLQVQASGDPPIEYQWQLNGADLADVGNVSGSKSATLHITAAQMSNAGNYSVKVWNWLNQVQSSTIMLTVENPRPPTITAQLLSKTVAPGDSVTFGVSAAGTPTLRYLWYKDGIALADGPTGSGATISGTTTATLMINNAQTADQTAVSGGYSVVVQNDYGSIASQPATLTVMNPDGVAVSIQADPGLTRLVGDTVTLKTVVHSVSPVTYQWKFKDKDILGATASYLCLRKVELGNNGEYAVVVKNEHAQQKATATLTVNCDNIPHGNCDPYFTEVNDGEPLHLAAKNGTYALTMDTLLPPNSDAMNLTVFKVTEVDSGSLLINGQSWGPGNDTIGPADWVVWMPPITPNPSAPDAFKVSASNGDAAKDTAAVGVSIVNEPARRLFAWGDNAVGSVGNGRYGDMRNFGYWGMGPMVALACQAKLGVIPKDPRWTPYPPPPTIGYWVDYWSFHYNPAVEYEVSPQIVLDVPAVKSVISSGEEWNEMSSAVASDGTVWQWGFDHGDFLLGLPYARYWLEGNPDPNDAYSWEWDFPGLLFWKWGQPIPAPLSYVMGEPLYFASPTARLYQAPRSDGASEAFVGVKKIVGMSDTRIALKDDGTLWSWGSAFGGMLGRNPDETDDRVDAASDSYGMSPRRIAIVHNSPAEATADNPLGITNGYQFVDVECGEASVIALCQNGEVWWWGEPLSDMPVSKYYGTVHNGSDPFGWSFDLLSDDNVEHWRPKHLTEIDNIANIGSHSPIVQIAACWNHFIALREDGKVFEFGYIPQLDSDGLAGYGFAGSIEERANCYKREPQQVTGIPGDVDGKIIAVAAGRGFGAALSKSGHVWIWGHCLRYPDVHVFDYVPPDPPHEITERSGIIKIAASGNDWYSSYLLALDKSGRVFGLGNNDWPVILGGSQNHYSKDFVAIEGLEQVTDIIACPWNAFAVGVAADPNRIVAKAAPGDSRVTLTWSAYAPAKSYIVYRADNPSDPLDDTKYIPFSQPVTGNEYQDTGLANGTIYYYKVSALVNGVEMEKSWETSATPRPVPHAIASNDVYAVSECRGIELAWTWSALPNETGSQVKGYKIMRNSGGGSSALVGITDTMEFFDDTVVSGNTYDYQVIPVNDSGQPTGNADKTVTFNPSGCGRPPYIDPEWRAHDWFHQRQNQDSSDQATLCWADPSAGWDLLSGGTIVGFRIHYRYTDHGIPSGSTYVQDVDVAKADTDGTVVVDGHSVHYYSYTWPTLGLNCYVSVSALIDYGGGNIQEGESSIEVGPASIDASSLQWDAHLTATPGYHQVYLEWPANDSLCLYDVYRTSTRPGVTPQDHGSPSIWGDPFARGITDPHCWDSSAMNTLPPWAGFIGTDITDVNSLVASLSAQDNPVSAALYKRWTAAERTEIVSGMTADTLAGLLSTAIKDRTDPVTGQPILLSPTDFQTVDKSKSVSGGVFTPMTKDLFNESQRESLSAEKRCLLNRLIVEEAYSSFGYGNWVKSMNAFTFYYVEATECGGSGAVDTGWVQGRPDDNASGPAQYLTLKLNASAYSGMVNLDWNFSKLFTGVSSVAPNNVLFLGSTSVQVISAKRYNGTTLVATGVEGTDYTVHSDVGTVTIPAGSDLVGQSSDSVQITFALTSASANWQSKIFTGVVSGGDPLQLGSTSVQVISAKRYNGTTWEATGVEGTDYTVHSDVGTVTIPAGSDLICQSGDSVQITFAPTSASPNWQFCLERSADSGTTYQRITEFGFGLAYLDQDVVNGRSYVYRVTATDKNFNRWQAVSAAVTPQTGDSLTLSATAGNNYVDLAWPPIRATQFTIEHSLSADSGFQVVGTKSAPNAYQNPINRYRHVGAQNNMVHYYKVIATTPTGVQIESPVANAMPLASLAPLPPCGFSASQVQDSLERKFLLTWNREEGVSKFQLFYRANDSLSLIYEGSNPGYYFDLPAAIQQKLASAGANATATADFDFAVRSVNFSGVAGDLNEQVFTWTEDSTSAKATVDSTLVHLKVAGQLWQSGSDTLLFTGPTNLALSVDISIPNIKRVSFYDYGNLLGTTEAGSTEFLWRHVPGGDHSLSAKVEAGSQDLQSLAASSTYAVYTTPAVPITVTIQPQLNAFNTSVTDLQLPAPGLPITLSRSYTSRSTSKGDGDLATGWSANWLGSSVKLASNLGSGWKGDWSQMLGNDMYYIGESSPHDVTINLPGGQDVQFAPHLNYNPANEPSYYDASVGVARIDSITFDGFMLDQGYLVEDSINSFNVTAHNGDLLGLKQSDWDIPLDLGGGNVIPGSFTYTAPDGTQYIFEHTSGLNYRLQQIADRNGNTLTYAYDGSGKLTSITHSSGRKVSFNYNQTPHEIHVFDDNGPTPGTDLPVLKYVFDATDTTLLKVLKLKERTAPNNYYETTTYVYGSTDNGDPTAAQGRIIKIFDARNIQILANSYQGGKGDLLSQTDAAARTTTFNYNSSTGELTVTKSWTDANNHLIQHKVIVDYDSSGAITGAAQPSDDNYGTQPTSTLTYDDRGLVKAQTDANSKTKTYGYDDKDRLVSQTDENGNSTTIQPDDGHFGQPGITKDANGNETDYIYDPQGNPLNVKDPSGTPTSYTYADAVTSSGLGRRTRSQRLDAPFVPFTIVTEYAYYGDDSGDNSPSMGDIKSTTEKWVQTINSSTDQTIGTSVITYFEYDADGNRKAEIKQRTLADGVTVQYIRTEFTYDALNRVTDTQIKAIQSTSGTPPTASDWASASVLAHTHIQTYYNALGKQSSTIDGYNRTTYYTYDVSGNLIQTLYPDNTVTRTSYDENNRVEYVQDRVYLGGNATTAPATKTTYDPAGRVSKVERLASVTLTSGQQNYPAPNNITAPADTMTPSSPGSVLTTTYTFYDNVGRVQYSVNASGVITEYGYDPAGRRTMSKVYLPDKTGSYTYGDNPPLPPSNAPYVKTLYGYDKNGNQTSVTAGITADDANGQVTTYVYDAANRLTQTFFPATQGSAPASRVTAYDGLGRRIQETDENRVSTGYGYDFRGLLTSVNVGLGTPQEAVTSYAYDEIGNLTKQTDANNHVTRFAYDALGRRTSRTLPDTDNNPEIVTYDDSAVGSLPNKAVTDFNGNKTKFFFDSMDRPVSKSLPAIGTDFPATTVAYTYDLVGRQAQVVQSDPSNQSDPVNRMVRYAYDTLGRLRVKNTPEGTLTYAYDALGTVTKISARYAYATSLWVQQPEGGYLYEPSSWESPDNRSTDTSRAEWNYTYDSLGRLQKVNPDTAPATTADATYTYDSIGNLQTTTYRNGLVTTYTYNERNWLRLMDTVNSSSAEMARFDYDGAAVGANWTSRHLSPVGQRQRVDELINGSTTPIVNRTVDYDYDTLRRLTKEFSPGTGSDDYAVRYDTVTTGSTTEGYDMVGNRRSRTVSGSAASTLATVGLTSFNDTGSASHHFDTRDLLLGPNPSTPNFQYDLNGNTVQYTADSQTASYIYDAENRLVKQTIGGSAVTLVYDADGNRVGKTVGTTTTKYLVDDRNPTGYAQVMEEFTCTEPPASGLLGYWPMEEGAGTTTADASGNGGTGTLVNAPAWSDGYGGSGGLDFSGNNYVSIPDSDAWAFGNNDFTIECWMNLRSLDQYWWWDYPDAVFVANDEGGGDINKWMFGLFDGTLTLLVDDPVNGPQVFGQVSFNPDMNAWYHVAVVRQGYASKFYVNGVLAGSENTYVYTMPNANAPLTIGQAEGIGYVNGLIDEMAIYNRALSAGEVSGLAGRRTKYVYGLGLVSETGGDGTTHYYGFDGLGSVRYLTDASGIVTDTYTYDAFGIQIDSSGSTANNYRYTGQQWDSDLGMYYLRARYYKPELGRFWTMDSYEGNNEDPLSLHKYLYGADNPVNEIDPSGEDFEMGAMLSVMDIGGMLAQIGAPVTTRALSAVSEGESGPDVTASLNKTLDDVKQKFTSLPDRDAKACCRRMVSYFHGGYTKAWDIGILFDIGANRSDTYGWGRTVTFNSYVYYGGAVNYALWGEMFALAHQRFGSLGIIYYDLDTALALATAYKAQQYGFDNEALQALWFTRYGYDRTLPPPAAAEAGTANLTPITAYQGSFSVQHNWKWFPNDVMGWKWLPKLNANAGIP